MRTREVVRVMWLLQREPAQDARCARIPNPSGIVGVGRIAESGLPGLVGFGLFIQPLAELREVLGMWDGEQSLLPSSCATSVRRRVVVPARALRACRRSGRR